MIRSSYLFGVAVTLLVAPALAETPDLFAARSGMDPDTALYMDAWSGRADAVDRPGGRRAAHFDSGADFGYLYERGVALLSAAQRASIVKARRKIGGLGAIVEEQVRRVPQADLRLAGQPLVLKNLDIAKNPDTGEAAKLGEDVLQAYGAVVFDFGAMTFSISP